MGVAEQIAQALKGRRSAPGKWRAKCPVHNGKTSGSLSIAETPDDGVLLHCFGGCEFRDVVAKLRELFPGVVPDNLGTSPAPVDEVPALTSLGIGEFIRQRPPLTWLIKGAIPTRGVGALIGPPAAGKTFVALHLTTSFLSGTPWFGHKIKESGGVLVLQAEGGAGLVNRLKAHMQLHPKTDWTSLRIIDRVVDITDPAQQDALIDEIRRLAQFWTPPRLLIIDTLNATMGSGDENTSEGMGNYKRAMLRISSACDLFALVIHHTGKDPERGARGHSSLLGAVDAEFLVAVEMMDDPADENKRYPRQIPTGRRYMESTKARDWERMSRQYFELERVNLYKDEDGDDVTSCVVKPVSGGWDG